MHPDRHKEIFDRLLRAGFTGTCVILMIPLALAQSGGVLIAPEDTLEQIVAKAAHVRPHPRQVAWQEKEFTAFIHFGMNTFTDAEWGSGQERPTQFMPTQFDAHQWVQAFKSAEMRGVVLTAKHHDGFCLWQTDTTEHSIKNSPWRDGKGDVVREVSDACRAAGLAFGVYLSPWDRNTQEFGKPGYNKIFQQQLRELLTRYGKVYDVWFDGAHAPRDKPEIFDWSGHYRLIRQLQPGACISVMGPDVRWCGNEAGHTRDQEWNVVPLDSSDPRPAAESQETTEALVNRFDDRAPDLGSRAVIRNARQLIWRPAMTNTSIRPGWFYHQSQDHQVRSLENLLDIYYRSVGGNTQFLLNVPPDRRGLVHEHDVRRLVEMGTVLRATFDRNFLANAHCPVDSDSPVAPSKSIDGNLQTYHRPDHGSSLQVEYRLPGAHTFNVAMVQEAIAEGQRVERFEIDAWLKGRWESIADGTTIGYKRLLRFEDVTTDRVRIRVVESRLSPMIAELGLFYAPPILAAPVISRDRQAMVSISAQPGVAVRYTLDGSLPNAESRLYQQPFPLPKGGQVRAIAIPNDKTLDLGANRLAEREFGRAKTRWRVVHADSDEPTADNHARMAIDDDPRTFWHTQWRQANPDYPHEIVIDLGESLELAGLAYLPRQDGADGGLVARYEFYLSAELGKWGEPVAVGEFANILNNPIQQRVMFDRPRTGRFIRFVALSSPNGKPWAGAAEIDVIE
jgi:alpha-L-fucosidase